MRIEFVRTGGFAGLRMVATINVNELPPEEAQEIRDELNTANFFNLPTRLMPESGEPDRFQYEVTVENGQQQHTVVAGEAALPDHVQPLVRHLERLARTRRR